MKKLIGKKSSNDKGYAYAPYIHMQTIIFPDITLAGYDKYGKPKFKKIC